MIGQKILVKIALNVMHIELIAPSTLPISKALAVPIPCDDVPNPIPFEIGCFTLNRFMTYCPNIAPEIPAAMTYTAVSVGVPPLSSLMSIAIGVVTDLGAKERIRF